MLRRRSASPKMEPDCCPHPTAKGETPGQRESSTSPAGHPCPNYAPQETQCSGWGEVDTARVATCPHVFQTP